MLYPLIFAASLEQRSVEFLNFMEQVFGFCEPYEVKSFIFYCSFIHLVHFSQLEPASLLWDSLSYFPP